MENWSCTEYSNKLTISYLVKDANRSNLSSKNKKIECTTSQLDLEGFNVAFFLSLINEQKMAILIKDIFTVRVLWMCTVYCRQQETEIIDSVMGPAVYDSRIRPSGINQTGNGRRGKVFGKAGNHQKIDNVRGDLSLNLDWEWDKFTSYPPQQLAKVISQDGIKKLL